LTVDGSLFDSWLIGEGVAPAITIIFYGVIPVSLRLSSLALSAILYLVSGDSNATGQLTIYITTVGNSKFDVVYHRAKSNGTGAALGGLIGAGIQAGVENEKDQKKRSELNAGITKELWKDAFVKTLNETFIANGYQVKWGESQGNKDEKADIYLTLYPSSYGLRMVDTSMQAVSAYIEFQVGYATEVRKGGRQNKETFYLTRTTGFSPTPNRLTRILPRYTRKRPSVWQIN
jgi:hypothetical protein